MKNDMKKLLYYTLIAVSTYTAGCMPVTKKPIIPIEQSINLENNIVDFVEKDNKKIILSKDGNSKDFYNLKLGDFGDINLANYIYLCKGDSNFYGYVQDFRKITKTDSIGREKIIIKKEYSNKIVEIDSKGNETFFKYAPCIPAGLFFDEGKLWYLYHSEDKSLLVCFENNNLPRWFEIPASNAAGLSIKNGIFTTFDKYLKLFINFKLEDCTHVGKELVDFIEELNKIKKK